MSRLIDFKDKQLIKVVYAHIKALDFPDVSEFDKILEKVEFGEFIFGNEELLKNSCIV